MKKLWLLPFLLFSWAAFAQQPVFFPAPPSPQSLPITNSVSGTTATLTATLTGAPNKWTYVCGFVITSGGTSTATVVNPLLSGTVSQHTFIYDFVSTGQGILGVAYPGCLVSSAQSTNISLTLPGTGTPGGANQLEAIDLWGYLN